jgi:hypothetical protein
MEQKIGTVLLEVEHLVPRNLDALFGLGEYLNACNLSA